MVEHSNDSFYLARARLGHCAWDHAWDRGWTRNDVRDLHQAQWSLTKLKSHTALATSFVDRNQFASLSFWH